MYLYILFSNHQQKDNLSSSKHLRFPILSFCTVSLNVGSELFQISECCKVGAVRGRKVPLFMAECLVSPPGYDSIGS